MSTPRSEFSARGAAPRLTEAPNLRSHRPSVSAPILGARVTVQQVGNRSRVCLAPVIIPCTALVTLPSHAAAAKRAGAEREQYTIAQSRAPKMAASMFPERLESIPRSEFRVSLSEAPPSAARPPRTCAPIAQLPAHPNWGQAGSPKLRQVNIIFNATPLFGAPPQHKRRLPIPLQRAVRAPKLGARMIAQQAGNRGGVCLIGSWLWTQCVDGRSEVLPQHQLEKRRPPEVMLPAEPGSRPLAHHKIDHQHFRSLLTVRRSLYRARCS
jgi:hypothetical protein